MLKYAIGMATKSIPWGRVAQRLEELEAGQAWLQANLRCAPAVITNWKSRGVPRSRAAEVASVLRVTTDWLLETPGAIKESSPQRIYLPSSEQEEGISAQEKRSVYRRSEDISLHQGGIEIPQFYGVGGSMGVGLLLRDQPGEIHGWRVTPEWISKNVKNHTGAGNLRIVTGFGDSMRPLYNPGDPLLVDAGVKAVEFDSIYFFRIGDEGFIKRLQRVPGQGLVAISENKSYRDWVITPDMDFEVFARVIKVWCGSDF